MEIARHWVSERAGLTGLVIAAIFAGCLALFLTPVGQGHQTTGRITGIGLVETVTGSYPIAVVLLPAGSVQVQLPRENNCAIGGEVRLIKQPYLLRSAYRPASPPC